MDYTVADYNVTIFRGHVREDGRILHGIRSDGALEWRKPDAYKKHEQKRAKRNANKKARRKHWLSRFKLHHGCSVCGEKNIHPTSLHMDHIDPSTKIANVSDLATGNLRRFMEEVRKCRVICFLCHVEHTAEQRKRGEIQ